jgi:hypothetical protein
MGRRKQRSLALHSWAALAAEMCTASDRFGGMVLQSSRLAKPNAARPALSKWSITVGSTNPRRENTTIAWIRRLSSTRFRRSPGIDRRGGTRFFCPTLATRVTHACVTRPRPPYPPRSPQLYHGAPPTRRAPAS